MSRPIPLLTRPAAASGPVPALAAPATWRPARLHAAPHRLAFAAGTSVLMLAATWWAALLMAGDAGWAAPAGLPGATVHALLMGFGFLPLFFTGFLFTAGPRWLGVPAPDARRLRGPVQAQAAGAILLLGAAFARDPLLGRVLGAIGMAAIAAGWGRSVLGFGRLIARSREPDRLHATLVWVAGAFGAALMAIAAGSLAAGRPDLVHDTVRVALFAFVGVVCVAVAHRMLPLLDVGRPGALLATFVGVMAFEGWVRWAPMPATLQAAVEGAAGVGVLALVLRGGILRGLRHRLPAMLHLGFAWLGAALLLAAASHALEAAGRPGLGLAPLHAYTMGFVGSLLLAMVTRVSAGHSGRAVAADTLAWSAFWVLQGAAIGRIMAEVAGWPTLSAAALLWAAALLPWGARHLGWYGRPRIDGRPG